MFLKGEELASVLTISALNALLWLDLGHIFCLVSSHTHKLPGIQLGGCPSTNVLMPLISWYLTDECVNWLHQKLLCLKSYECSHQWLCTFILISLSFNPLFLGQDSLICDESFTYGSHHHLMEQSSTDAHGFAKGAWNSWGLFLVLELNCWVSGTWS